MHITHSDAARPDAAPEARSRRCSPARRRCSTSCMSSRLGALRHRPRPEARARRRSTLAWTNVPAGGQATRAGQLRAAGPRAATTCRRCRAETRFPLGLFRAWTVWRPARATCWSIRASSADARRAAGRARRCPAARRSDAAQRHGGEVEGVRAYRRGDPLQADRLEEGRAGARDRRRAGAAATPARRRARSSGSTGPRAPAARRPRSACRAWRRGRSRPTAPAPTTASACPASRSSRPTATRSARAAWKRSRCWH